ncbi:MAG: YihY family inner membrane protein [Deltaproteobacteria bacterium]|nr:YihY family inner membrane protein [Deltaproteobacteria bacterium]
MKTFFTQTLWEMDTPILRWYRRIPIYLARLVATVVKGYRQNKIPVRATALAYTTLISIVPFLAVTFSLFKAFGGLNQAMEPIKRFVLSNLATGTGDAAITYLDQFIENFRSGAVGLVGFMLLILSVISVLATIEQAFNDIWGIPKSRTFIRRFTSYWTIITIGPVLLGISLSLTGALQSSRLVNDILSLSGAQRFLIAKIPWLVTFGMFTALYLIMPNTKVRVRSALLGGIIGGSLWEVAKWGYTLYATQVVSTYKVYGSLGMVPIFLVWIYYTWVVVLVGALVAFANEHLHQLKGDSPKGGSPKA